jgi:hypothetical protein
LFRFRKKKKRNIEENRKRKEKKKQKEPYLGRPIGRSAACGTEIAPAASGS